MNNVWQYFRSLFQSEQDSSATQPFLHEMIERTEEEKVDYHTWKEQLVCKRLLNWLADQYAIFSVAPDDIDESLDFLNTASSKGFVIHFHKTQYTRREATHLLDLFKEKMQALGYRTQISDVRTYTKNNNVETIERHYVKPRPNFKREGPFDQQFGNVTIELDLRNERPHYLKFRATTYNDSQFKEAKEFRELMQQLLL
jgi:hypothetical protein